MLLTRDHANQFSYPVSSFKNQITSMYAEARFQSFESNSSNWDSPCADNVWTHFRFLKGSFYFNKSQKRSTLENFFHETVNWIFLQFYTWLYRFLFSCVYRKKFNEALEEKNSVEWIECDFCDVWYHWWFTRMWIINLFWQ